MGGLLLKYVFVILHIITAAGWFGLALSFPRRARLAHQLGPQGGAAVAEDVSRTFKLMQIFLLLTLVFALSAFFLGGGFAAYGPPYHTSLLLILVLVAVQWFVLRPAWEGVRRAIETEERSAAVGDRLKRVGMAVGIGHLIWLILLVMMFWNSFAAGL